MKAFIVTPDNNKIISNIHRLVDSLDHSSCLSIVEADYIIFSGTKDVSPSLYGEKPHPLTRGDKETDINELYHYLIAKKNDIPMVGIGRGAQFLNVLNGGRLYQHVTNHNKCHPITDVLSGKEFQVTSGHHQMMRPHPDGKVLAYACQESVKEYVDNDYGEIEIVPDKDDTDPEAVFYPASCTLCFQPHPEWAFVNSFTYFKKLLDRYIIRGDDVPF